MDISKLKTWHFGENNDNLVELVLKGEKTATTSLLNDYNEEEIPKVGNIDVLIFDNEKKACITKTTNVIITEFKNITEEQAKLEGEGDKTLEYYRNAHISFFNKIDPNFNDNTKVVFEEFEILEDLTKTRLLTAKKIVDENLDIFGNKNHEILEINAGFNNDIFAVDDRYIIKVCANKDKESQFDIEYNFYLKNCNCKYIPKMYRYDKSKKIIPYIYEVIEKIEGKTLYYYWYKMTEVEREETIKELVNILKDIHKEIEMTDNWSTTIKERIQKNYFVCKRYFSDNEQELIESAINKFDEYLKDNKYVLIHRDLHFDNIIKNDNGLYIIDFNDSIYAPFDYDLRLLFMHKDTPWKWANTEMDPYQKVEDYKNIVDYIKKYYSKLNEIKYLDERMIIYKMDNDMNLLTRFNNDELKKNIISYSKELMLK